jgi:hypothetical protein
MGVGVYPTREWGFNDQKLLWLVVWNMDFIFPFSWEFDNPNFHIFQDG